MMLSDLHVHTRFSGDSRQTMAAACESAIANGVSRVAFTDHVDNNPADYYFGFYDATGYFAELEQVRR